MKIDCNITDASVSTIVNNAKHFTKFRKLQLRGI